MLFPVMRMLGISVTALPVAIAAFALPQSPKKGRQQTPFQVGFGVDFNVRHRVVSGGGF
jgi:hypothetical protein